MDLNYIVDGNQKTLKILEGQGIDQEALLLVCQELLNLQKDLNLENGDLKDLVFRLKNRYDSLSGLPPDVKIKSEDMCPSRITFQPNGYKHTFFFARCPDQNDIPYKLATFYCEICGISPQLRKKEIKGHVVNVHKVNLTVY